MPFAAAFCAVVAIGWSVITAALAKGLSCFGASNHDHLPCRRPRGCVRRASGAQRIFRSALRSSSSTRGTLRWASRATSCRLYSANSSKPQPVSLVCMVLIGSAPSTSMPTQHRRAGPHSSHTLQGQSQSVGSSVFLSAILSIIRPRMCQEKFAVISC